MTNEEMLTFLFLRGWIEFDWDAQDESELQWYLETFRRVLIDSDNAKQYPNIDRDEIVGNQYTLYICPNGQATRHTDYYTIKRAIAAELPDS